jgi:hypothetical protein
MPFFLVYGFEAILPADIMWKSPRVEMYNEGEADEARQLELDSVEEVRYTVLVQSARYLQGVRCGRTNLNYTGSSTRVHFRGLQRASNGIIPWPVG